jgi:hypothetical protein
MFGRIVVVADHEAPQSADVNQTIPAPAIGTTTRPQTPPGGAPGGGGWTSGTPPIPCALFAVFAGGDQVSPPSVEVCILIRALPSSHSW